jgi:predicted N-acetyltransferase YhbS
MIRPETITEHEAIRAIHDAAFGEPDEGRIVDAVRGEQWFEPGLSLVAVADAGVVGHVLLSVCTVEALDGRRTGEVLALGPIAVRPDRQRGGIGGRLVEEAIGVGRARGWPAVVLLGHATYYPRFGFIPARSLGLEAPAPWPDEVWLAIVLADGIAIPQGVVRYPSVFEPL